MDEFEPWHPMHFELLPRTMLKKKRRLKQTDSAAKARHRSRMKPINIEAPDYQVGLKIRPAHRQTGVRRVILSALVKDGFIIAEADIIEDGRRARGRALTEPASSQ